jgi:uncharacterized protein (DUF2235 family)
MGKNVVIYSDGTGQAGGFRFDENRSNIYKLYRATRYGPDSIVDPNVQVTFYDPGLGSQADGGHLFGWLARAIYNLVSQATGFGITANIIDCYAALIHVCSPQHVVRAMSILWAFRAVYGPLSFLYHDRDGAYPRQELKISRLRS